MQCSSSRWSARVGRVGPRVDDSAWAPAEDFAEWHDWDELPRVVEDLRMAVWRACVCVCARRASLLSSSRWRRGLCGPHVHGTAIAATG